MEQGRMVSRMTFNMIAIDDDEWGSTTINMDQYSTETHRDINGENLGEGYTEKMVGETHDSWSGYEKKTHPSKRLIWIEDCHNDSCTEWIGVMLEKEQGRASILFLPRREWCGRNIGYPYQV